MTPCVLVRYVPEKRIWRMWVRELVGAVSDVIDWFEKLGEAFVNELGRP